MPIYQFRLKGRTREIEGEVVEQGARFESSYSTWGDKSDYEFVQVLDGSATAIAPTPPQGDSRNMNERLAEFLGPEAYANLLEEMESAELDDAEAAVEATNAAPAPAAKQADIPTREAIKGLGMAGARDLARSISAEIPLTSWDALLNGIDEHRA